MPELHVATLNIRNLADRWPERLPLLLADTAALQPDVLGLQEVVYPLEQDRLLGASGAARYRVLRGWAGRPEYGNSLLVRDDLSPTHAERLDLGLGRAAHATEISVVPGVTVHVTVAHLHSPPNAHAERVDQVRTLLAWLGDDRGPAQIVVGDFNADPREPAYSLMNDAGFRSAFFETHGTEPVSTWPSGLQAEMIDMDGEPDCLDYIWFRGRIGVNACRLVYDRPAADDPTLYPSDHIGLSATFEVGPGN